MGDHYPNLRRAQREGGPYGRRGGVHPRRRNGSFAGQMIGGCLTVGVLSFVLAPEIQSFWHIATQPAEKAKAVERSSYYRNCDAARTAGVAPIYRGSPGYREGMDGDSDGIACEPYR